MNRRTSQRQVERASHQDVLNWWQRFKISYQYPLYCLFFISDADKEAVEFLNKHGFDIANSSGEHCLIIFFHNGTVIEEMSQSSNQNRSITILDLKRVLDIGDEYIPCAVFFDDMPARLRVIVSLKDKSIESISTLFRELFCVLQNEKYDDKLVLLWEHQFAKDNPSLIEQILKAVRSTARAPRTRFSS